MKVTRQLASGLMLLLLSSLQLGYAQDATPQEITELSQAYALLYQTVNKIDKLGKLLYVKFESDPVDALATELGEHADTAQEDIEQYAQSHPGINLEETGLPKAEQARRSYTTKALLKDVATHSGTEFERLYLLAMTNVVNQARHMASAVADLPQDQAGKNLASRLHEQFDSDYAQVNALLDSNYFCSPN